MHHSGWILTLTRRRQTALGEIREQKGGYAEGGSKDLGAQALVHCEQDGGGGRCILVVLHERHGVATAREDERGATGNTGGNVGFGVGHASFIGQEHPSRRTSRLTLPVREKIGCCQ